MFLVVKTQKDGSTVAIPYENIGLISEESDFGRARIYLKVRVRKGTEEFGYITCDETVQEVLARVGL